MATLPVLSMGGSADRGDPTPGWRLPGWVFYSSSISLSAAGSGEVGARVGSGGLSLASRSFAIL